MSKKQILDPAVAKKITFKGILQGKAARHRLLVPGWDKKYHIELRPVESGMEEARIDDSVMRIGEGDDGPEAGADTAKHFRTRCLIQVEGFLLPAFDGNDEIVGDLAYNPKREGDNSENRAVYNGMMGALRNLVSNAMACLNGSEIARTWLDDLENEHGPLLTTIASTAPSTG